MAGSLLERGSNSSVKRKGRSAGVGAGLRLWTEARTPTGIVVPLASPGTDELGVQDSRTVNNHFWNRFGRRF